MSLKEKTPMGECEVLAYFAEMHSAAKKQRFFLIHVRIFCFVCKKNEALGT